MIAAGILWGAPLAIGVLALGRRPGVRSLVIACAVLPVAALLLALVGFVWYPLKRLVTAGGTSKAKPEPSEQ